MLAEGYFADAADMLRRDDRVVGTTGDHRAVDLVIARSDTAAIAVEPVAASPTRGRPAA
ncbi:MAG: hypothetical protein V3R98_00185 [Alphaproteobacteria bacterium]